MQNDYLSNKKKINLNNEIKFLPLTQKDLKVSIVDINKLLNRVKIEEKNKVKKNLIIVAFLSFIISIFGLIVYL